MSEYLVDIQNVDKTFMTRHIFQRDEQTGQRRLYRTKKVHAVAQVSFSIKPGEIFGLLGPNGAGKTTTVKMISGLVRPDSGSVYVDGLEVERRRLEALKRIGVVLEGTRTSIWPLTPLENLAYFGNLRNVRGRVLKERSESLLDFIGLRDKMNTQVRRLSRGQKQRLAICIALITDPPVVLLDEPTTGLDVQSSRAIREKITQMAREQGKCALVTTHDMAVAQTLCDRIGIISNGKLVTCKPTVELLDVFSEQTFEFKLDKLPDMRPFEELPGVTGAESEANGDGAPVLLVHYTPDDTARSEALYSTIERLKAEGCVLHSIGRRQQTLENVFVHLTGESHKG